jgi:hypothetical protein
MVYREAADMVLLDSFGSIIVALEYGQPNAGFGDDGI